MLRNTCFASLWNLLWLLLEERKHSGRPDVVWEHVSAHKGIAGNEEVFWEEAFDIFLKKH
jgi:hypothetical protein